MEMLALSKYVAMQSMNVSEALFFTVDPTLFVVTVVLMCLKFEHQFSEFATLLLISLNLVHETNLSKIIRKSTTHF